VLHLHDRLHTYPKKVGRPRRSCACLSKAEDVFVTNSGALLKPKVLRLCTSRKIIGILKCCTRLPAFLTLPAATEQHALRMAVHDIDTGWLTTAYYA